MEAPKTEEEYLSKELFPLTNRQNLKINDQMLIDAVNRDDLEEFIQQGNTLTPGQSGILEELRLKAQFTPRQLQ